MGPITTAIIAALAKLSEHVIKDGYTALKSALLKKCGLGSEVEKALISLEAQPESKGRCLTLDEELTNANLNADPELGSIAKALIEKIGSVPGGTQVVQKVYAFGKDINVAGRDVNR